MLTGANNAEAISPKRPSMLKRALRVEWLGQTLASIFWIVSVFTYGISALGDWLQLLAASAWFIANLATLVSPASDELSKSVVDES